MKPALFFSLTLLGLGIVLSLASILPEPPIPDASDQTPIVVRVRVEAAVGDVLEAKSGHRLIIPAGALEENTVITMTTIPIAADATGVVYGGVELEPSGLPLCGRQPWLYRCWESTPLSGSYRWRNRRQALRCGLIRAPCLGSMEA